MSTELLQLADSIIEKANLPDRHTFFQIEKLIVGKECTVQAQLWCIVRELQARRETVDVFETDLKEAEDNLEMLDVKIERLNRRIKYLSGKEGKYTDLNIKECEINIRKFIRNKEQIIKSAQKVTHKYKSILEEMNFLIEGFKKIVSVHGDIKPLDDIESQKEMWNEKLLEEINLRLLLQRPLDTELIRTIMCMPNDTFVKQKTVNLIKALNEQSQKAIQQNQVEQNMVEYNGEQIK